MRGTADISAMRQTYQQIRRRLASPAVQHCAAGKRPRVACGQVSAPRVVPASIRHPPYAKTGIVPEGLPRIILHNEDTLGRMREACQLARRMLDLSCALAKIGTTTDAIDAEVHQAIVDAGAYPSPLNYSGFPKSLCSSVNDIICHGIPDDRPLDNGDIVSFDVSVYLNGFHGDNCATVAIGEVDSQANRLMQAAKEALDAGIAQCKPDACLTAVGAAIHGVVDDYGYEVVRRYCGHGVGSEFHMQPFVQHFRNNDKLLLKPGMTFTIEPAIVEGSERSSVWSDDWTVATNDGGRAAQYEHVILITESGHEILTQC
jgi:methionyl aminopeptidase